MTTESTMREALITGLIYGSVRSVWALTFYGTVWVMYEQGMWGILR